MSAKLKAVLDVHAAWCAEKLGPVQQDWYVFPSCSRVAPRDPLKAVTTLKSAWASVCKTAKVKCKSRQAREEIAKVSAAEGVKTAAIH